MTEYSKIAEGQFISDGTAKFIELPFLPNTFTMWNLSNYQTPHTDNAILNAFSDQNRDPGFASATYWDDDLGGLSANNLDSGGFTWVKAGTFQYGPTIGITAITATDPASVSTTSDHNLTTGDTVLVYGTTAMLQIAGEIYTVTVVDNDTFTIDVDASTFTPATGGFFKQVLYPDLYIPYRSSITDVSLGNTTSITTTVDHAFVVGQEVFIQIPTVTSTAWGTFQLDTETFNQQNVVPQQAYVLSVPSPNELIINVNSSGFGIFSYPTSAEASLGMTFPAVYAIGDQNFGVSGPGPFKPPITIPGAFSANTRQGVIIGIGGTEVGDLVMQFTDNVIRWQAIFPDLIV